MGLEGVRYHPLAGIPVLELAKTQGAQWDELCAVWSRIPDHPHVLRHVGHDARRGVVEVSHALLGPHGLAAAVYDDARTRILRTIVSGGLHVWKELGPQGFAPIGGIVIFLDLDDQVRLAFRPHRVARSGRVRERAVVEMIATAVDEAAGGKIPAARTLAKLADALGAPDASELRSAAELAQFRAVELGLGWSALGDVARADEAFTVVTLPRYREMVQRYRWAFTPTPVDRVIAHRPTVERIVVDEPSIMLDESVSAEAQYARGKQLLAAGRPHEAIVAFDTACRFDDTHAAAQLVRQHAARNLVRTSAQVGHEVPHAPIVPAHLVELATAIARGEREPLHGVIETLAADNFAADPDAQALLAHALASDLRHADAETAFDRAITLAPDSKRANELVITKAHTLIALDRAAEAIESVAHLGPSPAVLDLRTRALGALDAASGEVAERNELAHAANAAAGRVAIARR